MFIGFGFNLNGTTAKSSSVSKNFLLAAVLLISLSSSNEAMPHEFEQFNKTPLDCNVISKYLFMYAKYYDLFIPRDNALDSSVCATEY